MAYIYRVVPLTVDGGGHPIVADNYVSYQNIPGFYVVYNLSDGKYSTKAVINKDLISGKFLVGSETDFMNSLPTPQETLGDVFDADEDNWSCMRYAENSGINRHGIGNGWQLGDVPPGIWAALGVSAPLPVQFLPFNLEGACVGLIPSPPWSCGQFRANEASATATWRGDNLGIPLGVVRWPRAVDSTK